ncbi:MAG: oxidoreductase [Gemmatimonadetes bacterium]|nr:MAG: oxidoreductase [Gemmatimonadota bacterium]PYO64862.1 MAG: oxidoreductase [Gemmatimonadota bacterium]PYP64369.1 MAG: oxidoreductase [Gemmatimonadota bacterium]
MLDSRTLRLGGDLPVHRLGFGAMRLTGPGIWGEPDDRAEAIAVLRRALELGITLIDTADSYGPEVSERLIAAALHPYPKNLVIATKGGLLRPGPDRWTPDGRPEHLRAACEGSLRRLKIERIDLYQLHRIDPAVPLADQLGTLKELQAQGKIRHLGLSEVTVAEIERARRIVSVVSVQNLYNLSDRKHEAVLDHCERAGLAFIPWFPLASGGLAGPRGPLGKAAARLHAALPWLPLPRGRPTPPSGPLAQAAARLHATPAQVALAWLLRRSPVMLPIPGTSRVEHLEENVAAAGLELEEREFQAIGA